MILKTFLPEEPSVACTTILGLILSTGWCSSTEGANYHICEFCHNVSHTLHMYCFAIALLRLVMTGSLS